MSAHRPRRRPVLVAALVLAAALGAAGCAGGGGGGGGSPADRVTEPIDNARDTADLTEDRARELEQGP